MASECILWRWGVGSRAPRVSNREHLVDSDPVGPPFTRCCSCQRTHRFLREIVGAVRSQLRMHPYYEIFGLTADERDSLVERGAARTGGTHREVLVPDRHAAEEDEPLRG